MSTDRLESLLTFHRSPAELASAGRRARRAGQPCCSPSASRNDAAADAERDSRAGSANGRKPAGQGTPDFRTAAVDWLRGLPSAAGMIDADKQLLPVAGSLKGCS